MHEYELQKEIVQVAFSKAPLPSKHKGLQAYKFLVEYRFFEVLHNAYPLFSQIVDTKRFEEVVTAFMQYGARSNLMWKTPNEFRKFIKKYKYFSDIPYVHDLLWFEWEEVALMMKDYKTIKPTTFSWKNNYTLSPSATLKRLSYKVFEPKTYEQKGRFFLLAYYDFDQKRVFYRQIAEPLYLFLKTLKKEGLNGAVEYICQLSGESKKDVKAIFRPSLEELIILQVIQRSKPC